MRPTFLDHIVIIVRDVKTTTEFYSKLLGDPLFSEDEQVAWQVGDTKIFFGLPYKDYEWHDKDKYGLNHLAFGVASLEELKEFEKLLNDSNIKNSGIGIYKNSDTESIWLDDPDGYRIEFYLRK